MRGTNRIALPLVAFLALTALMAVLLSACAVGPDYRKPVVAASGAWHQSVAPTQSRIEQTQIDPQWWHLYRDPILSDLEAQIVLRNYDLRIAASNYAESLSERRIAGAAQFPQATGNASYARERASPNGVLGLLGTFDNRGSGAIADGSPGFGPTYLPGRSGAGAFNLPQFGLGASWEVDFWGHVRRAVESADASVRATDDTRRNLLVSLMAQTAQDYIALRRVQSQIGIVEQNLDIARRSVELTTLRFSQGAATRLDVADATGLQDTFQARLPVLQRMQVHLINALSFLVSEPPGALTARLAPRRDIPAVPDAIPVGLPSELAERRPDIRMAAERLHVATANIGVALADFYPRVTLSGSLDIQALQFSGLGTWASRQYGFGPSVTLPIFQGGRLSGQLELRREQQREAAVAFQRAVLNAWREIDDAMADFSTAQAQRDRLAAAVDQNREAVRIAQLQYAQGSADFLNVLTLQTALLSAQSDLVQATADVSDAVARLYRALGGGWAAWHVG